MTSLVSTMNEQGRVVIPAAIRRAMGIAGRTDLLFRYEDGQVVVETIQSAVAAVQDVVAEYRPSGVSLADELIAERRAEAAAE